jgi:hypothetical protein
MAMNTDVERIEYNRKITINIESITANSAIVRIYGDSRLIVAEKMDLFNKDCWVHIKNIFALWSVTYGFNDKDKVNDLM